MKDAALVALARPHGVVSTAQLRGAGFSPRAISRREAAGLLRRRHRGVYLVGPVEGPHARIAAALVACGPGATLSHHTAASLWNLPSLPRSAVDVTSATLRQHDGIRIHRNRLQPPDVTTTADLCITTPARTLLDIAAVVSPRDLARAVEESGVLGLTSHSALHDLLDRNPRARGARALGEAIAGAHEPSLTRSRAEARLLALIRSARLPPPQTNARVGRFVVDMLWPAARTIVEIDGYRFHSSRAAFERDRRRDAELQAAGYRVIRFTWMQITREPHAVIAILAGILATAERDPSAARATWAPTACPPPSRRGDQRWSRRVDSGG